MILENLINSLTIIVAIIALCFWIVVLMTLYLFFRQVKISEMERISTTRPQTEHGNLRDTYSYMDHQKYLTNTRGRMA